MFVCKNMKIGLNNFTVELYDHQIEWEQNANDTIIEKMKERNNWRKDLIEKPELFNKKILVPFIVIIITFLCFISCKANNRKYPEYTVKNNTGLGCVELVYEGITYRPYGILTFDFGFSKFMAKQIGIREDNPNCKIYELKGYDSREWIIDYLDVFMGGSMLLKSIDVIDIPKELERYKAYDF